MELIKNTNIDFLGKQKVGLILSGALIIIGVVSLILHAGPNFGIDFRGGVKVFAKFNRAVTEGELSTMLGQLGYDRAKVRVDRAREEAFIDLPYNETFTEQRVNARLASDPGDATAMSVSVSSATEKIHVFQQGDAVVLIDGEQRLRNEIADVVESGDVITFRLAEEIGADLTDAAEIQVQASVGRILADALLQGRDDWRALQGAVSVNEVGPSVGKDLKWAALWSALWAIVIMLLYIRVRFESFHFATGAIVALVHDVLITLGVFSVLATEINLPTVAAFLTIIGYSLNDTIVVFDRIRENTTVLKGLSLREIINKSINQSLSRTIITSLTTLIVVIAIFVLTSPGEEINTFAFALIVGVIVGTYSSVFIASPILDALHQRALRRERVRQQQPSTA